MLSVPRARNGEEVSWIVGGRFTGTYAISPAIVAVPEPNTFALLRTAVGLLGFHDPTEDTLRLLIPDDWAFEDLGPHALRGRSRPVRVDAVSRGQPAKRGADRIEGRLTLGRLTGPCP